MARVVTVQPRATDGPATQLKRQGQWAGGISDLNVIVTDAADLYACQFDLVFDAGVLSAYR